jgi:hypothetical protein
LIILSTLQGYFDCVIRGGGLREDTDVVTSLNHEFNRILHPYATASRSSFDGEDVAYGPERRPKLQRAIQGKPTDRLHDPSELLADGRCKNPGSRCVHAELKGDEGTEVLDGSVNGGSTTGEGDPQQRPKGRRSA